MYCQCDSLRCCLVVLFSIAPLPIFSPEISPHRRAGWLGSQPNASLEPGGDCESPCGSSSTSSSHASSLRSDRENDGRRTVIHRASGTARRRRPIISCTHQRDMTCPTSLRRSRREYRHGHQPIFLSSTSDPLIHLPVAVPLFYCLMLPPRSFCVFVCFSRNTQVHCW